MPENVVEIVVYLMSEFHNKDKQQTSNKAKSKENSV